MACIAALLLAFWTVAALYFDVRIALLRFPSIVAYVVATLAVLVYGKGFRRRLLGCTLCSLVVMLWWFTLRPSNYGDWQGDVARTILSFDFGDGHPVSFSIEARKHAGQSYSAIRGFFRQFTLISTVSDERDVVRLRTNYRKGEDLYLYHTTAALPFARALFLDCARFTNQLNDYPQWYNAITGNCTTEIFHLETMCSQPFDIAILLNGKGDAMEYRRGNLGGDGLPFDELKKRAYINPAARAANNDPDFSMKIREGRPGFPAAAVKP